MPAAAIEEAAAALVELQPLLAGAVAPGSSMGSRADQRVRPRQLGGTLAEALDDLASAAAPCVGDLGPCAAELLDKACAAFPSQGRAQARGGVGKEAAASGRLVLAKVRGAGWERV